MTTVYKWLAQDDAAQPEKIVSPLLGVNEESTDLVEQGVIAILKTIYDPEIPVNIYDLGLIYGLSVHDGHAQIQMTLTAPGCPVAQTFPGEIEQKVLTGVDGIESVKVELVWEPPWSRDRMSEAAQLVAGIL
ncbi:MAG: DUF59 domain-containing protein [Ferrovum sp.]|jgi:FeS assembly SUF system protein|nr:DUF59 domain-containing protein [Ferrovum sp.]